jgi:hypothetical protein
VTAIPKSAETSLQMQEVAESETTIDYDQAWEVLTDENSWKVAGDKQSVLAEDFGITSQAHLLYLDASEIQELASKLKKSLLRCWHLAIILKLKIKLN